MIEEDDSNGVLSSEELHLTAPALLQVKLLWQEANLLRARPVNSTENALLQGHVEDHRAERELVSNVAVEGPCLTWYAPTLLLLQATLALKLHY